jgi:hypothetical protein
VHLIPNVWENENTLNVTNSLSLNLPRSVQFKKCPNPQIIVCRMGPGILWQQCNRMWRRWLDQWQSDASLMAEVHCLTCFRSPSSTLNWKRTKWHNSPLALSVASWRIVCINDDSHTFNWLIAALKKLYGVMMGARSSTALELYHIPVFHTISNVIKNASYVFDVPPISWIMNIYVHFL